MTGKRRFLPATIVAALIAVAADIFLVLTEHHATPLPGSGVVGYWPFFAVFWFLIFVFASKWIGKAGIQQREDYYQRKDHAD